MDNYLPSKEQTIPDVAFIPIQNTYYKAIYENNTSFLFKGSKPGNAPSLMNVMMDVRKCYNQLFLICGADKCILSDAAAGGPHKLEQDKLAI